MDWIWAGVAIVGGFIVGTMASKIVRQTLEKRKGKVAQFAPAGASLAFSLIFVAGLLVALGFVQPDSLSKLRDDTINYLPRVLSALIVVILGGVVGTIVSTAVGESLGRSMGRMGEKIPGIIKGIVSAFAAILAASQLGIDTTVINIVVAAVVGGLALSFALIVGFGSRPVAGEIANGRALRRVMAPGDAIAADAGTGTIVALHPTAVEITTGEGTSLVPNSLFTAGAFQITRAEPEPDDDSAG